MFHFLFSPQKVIMQDTVFEFLCGKIHHGVFSLNHQDTNIKITKFQAFVQKLPWTNLCKI